MRVLVTGGSGFTGRFVVGQLRRGNHDVVALARSDDAAWCVRAAGAIPLRGDLDDPEGLSEVFVDAQADVLVNVASLGFGHAAGIVDAAERAGMRRAVFVSSTSIFTSLPARTKKVRAEAEQRVTASKLDWVIVRPTMIYGAPGDRNIERLLQLLRRTSVVPLPDGGRGLIQPVHVADLAAFIVMAMDTDRRRRAFNVAGPEALPLHQAVREAGDALGRSPRLLSVPLTPVLAAASLYGRLSRKPKITREQVLRLREDKAFDISEAASLGYAPRPFAEGVRQEVAALGCRG